MVFDRTIKDVHDAIMIRKNKVEGGQQLTAQDIETLERGFVTINTLNRIETAQARIKTELNNMGYYNTPITSKTWTANDVFTTQELERIVANNRVLRNAFFVYRTSPTFAAARFRYSDFNAIEKLLDDLDNMIVEFKLYYRECNTFYCGEDGGAASLWQYDEASGDLLVNPQYVSFDNSGNCIINLPDTAYDAETGNLYIGEETNV